jgi:hypothetical protein
MELLLYDCKSSEVPRSANISSAHSWHSWEEILQSHWQCGVFLLAIGLLILHSVFFQKYT